MNGLTCPAALVVLLSLTSAARATVPPRGAPLPPTTDTPLELNSLRLTLDGRVYGHTFEWENSQDEPGSSVSGGSPSFAGAFGVDFPTARAFALGMSMAVGPLRARWGCTSSLCGAFAVDLSFAPRIRLAVERTWELYVAGQVGMSILQDFDGDGVRMGPHVAQLIGFQKVFADRRSVFVEVGWHGYWHMGLFASSFTSHIACIRLGVAFGLSQI